MQKGNRSHLIRKSSDRPVANNSNSIHGNNTTSGRPGSNRPMTGQ